jgi:endonuclease YncB( thermonuclease family)
MVAGALVLMGPGVASASAATPARVLDIADGDTIKVTIGNRVEDVRLIGIDTPEVYFGEECGGAEASASIKRMLEVGDRVRLIPDRTQDNRDRYDRLLRYVVRNGREWAASKSAGVGGGLRVRSSVHPSPELRPRRILGATS